MSILTGTAINNGANNAVNNAVNNTAWSNPRISLPPDGAKPFLKARGWIQGTDWTWTKPDSLPQKNYTWSEALVTELMEVFLVMEE